MDGMTINLIVSIDHGSYELIYVYLLKKTCVQKQCLGRFCVDWRLGNGRVSWKRISGG